MGDDAIQDDVSIDPRQAAYDRLVQDRAEQQFGEEQEAEDVGPSVEFSDEEGRVYRIPAKARFRAKVDGQEEEVDLDRLTRGYQKGAAADRRLQEANERAQQLAQREQEFAARVEAFQQQERPPQKRGDAKEVARAFYDAVLEDDEETAIEKIASAVESFSGGVDQDAVARLAGQVAEERIAKREQAKQFQERERARNDANQWFTDNFPEIVEHPHLLRLAMSLGQEKWQANPNANPMELVREIGEEVRSFAGGPTPQRRKPASRPSPRTSTTIPPKPEKRELTREEVLQEMKKARGFPV